jgi:hypothetical protein
MSPLGGMLSSSLDCSFGLISSSGGVLFIPFEVFSTLALLLRKFSPKSLILSLILISWKLFFNELSILLVSVLALEKLTFKLVVSSFSKFVSGKTLFVSVVDKSDCLF